MTIQLDILSDPICPWCYFGKIQLDVALTTAPDHPFMIEWRPFQLNPDMPNEGLNRQDYLETKFGGSIAAQHAYAPIYQFARDHGIPMNLDAIERTPNTLDAHRLIYWAGIEGRQPEIVDALFQAYFVHGRDIGLHEVLADIADSNGLDAAVILQLLKTNVDVDAIQEHQDIDHQMGIQSVPTFIFDRQHAVSGAQSVDKWLHVIRRFNEQG